MRDAVAGLHPSMLGKAYLGYSSFRVPDVGDCEAGTRVWIGGVWYGLEAFKIPFEACSEEIFYFEPENAKKNPPNLKIK